MIDVTEETLAIRIAWEDGVPMKDMMARFDLPWSQILEISESPDFRVAYEEHVSSMSGQCDINVTPPTSSNERSELS